MMEKVMRLIRTHGPNNFCKNFAFCKEIKKLARIY